MLNPQVFLAELLTKYFEKYGSIGTALQNHIGRDTGLYTFFAGFNNNEHFGEIDDKIVLAVLGPIPETEISCWCKKLFCGLEF